VSAGAPATRRDVVRALGAAAIAVSAAGVPAFAGPDPAAVLREVITALLGDPHAAARIGRSCLRANPEAAPRAALIALLADGAHGPAGTVAAIRQRVRQDFASGATVSAGGWILSSTEAQLYALAALTAPAA
jgi:hypothetical protein